MYVLLDLWKEFGNIFLGLGLPLLAAWLESVRINDIWFLVDHHVR